jgi:excisionase family DNA binding protein
MFDLYEPLLDELAKRTAKLVIEALEKKKTIQQEYFTVEQAGTYIGKTKEGMTALLKQRQIPIIKIGARVHIAKKDLDTYMMNHRQ